MITSEQAQLAAIIGYWRNGMSWEEISLITGLSVFEVECICFNHSKKNPTL